MGDPLADLDGERLALLGAPLELGVLRRVAEGRLPGAAITVLDPLVASRPPDPAALEHAAAELALFPWLVVDSELAVETLWPLCGGGLPLQLRVAAAGTGARLALDAVGRPAALACRTSRGLGQRLGPHVGRATRVLVAGGRGLAQRLAAELRHLGADAIPIDSHHTEAPVSASATVAALARSGRTAIGITSEEARDCASSLIDRLPVDLRDRLRVAELSL